MNRGPELLGAPKSRAQKFNARKEYAILKNWGPAKGIKGPQVTVEPEPLKALLCHWA